MTYAEKNLLSDLEKLEAEFNESNKSMDVPYKCMMPGCVPNMQHYYIGYPGQGFNCLYSLLIQLLV